MSSHLYITLVTTGALIGLFLFSIKRFSYHIEGIFGDRFKSMLSRSTNTPLKGTCVGAIMTGLLQSSTAVSVLLVSLAGAGLISSTHALTAIIGANIGTSLLPQLVAFKVTYIAPYIVCIGLFIAIVLPAQRKIGKAIFYFGIIFSCLYGLSLLAEGFKDMPFVLYILSHTSNLFIAITVGFIITNLLQLSSVVMGMIIVLASQGVLDLEQSIGLIVGANIGTTTTALIASLVTNTEGKRVALGHLLFSIIGTLLLLPFIEQFTHFISTLTNTTSVQVAYAHLLFNVLTATVCIIGFKYYVRTVHVLVRQK